MCQREATPLERLVTQATAGTGAVVMSMAAPPASPEPAADLPRGSRRRRLWELDSHAHCPVLGVCLPMAALRRVVNKALGGEAVADDYALHCGAVADCQRRTRLAETVQRELDRRYALALRQASRAKDTPALAAGWAEALRCQDVAGALWATLSHPRCDAALEQRVLADVHMLQHQAGMAARADLDRFEALLDENAVLGRELAAAQQRSARQAAEHLRRSEAQQVQIVQLRAQVMARDTALAATREELAQLEGMVPALKARAELARENAALLERLHALQRQALQAEQEAERLRRQAEALRAELHAQAQVREAAAPAEAADAARLAAEAADAAAAASLANRAVLCVGGRAASVPLYRQLVEGTGGRFLHHDGGEEDGTSRLDATLAAADLVICQTGCISHGAYWRVKEHCKRTGKRCVFVETPSRAGLARALLALVPATPAPAG